MAFLLDLSDHEELAFVVFVTSAGFVLAGRRYDLGELQALLTHLDTIDILIARIIVISYHMILLVHDL